MRIVYQLQELNQDTYTWIMIAGSIYLSRCVEMLLEKQNIQSADPGFRQPQYRIVKQTPGLYPEVINHNYIIS